MKYKNVILGCLVSLGLIGTNAIANESSSFKIFSKVYIDNKLVSSPTIIALADKKAVISFADPKTHKNFKMELVASHDARKNNKDLIKIRFDIAYTNGQQNMHSHPVLIVLPNQKSEVFYKTDSGHVAYKIQVVAEKG